MAHIRRHPKSPDRWQVRYIDPTGKERAKNFGCKLDAERFLHTVEVEKIRGEWTNPDGGRTSFAEWSRQVQAGRIHLADSTSARDDSVLRSMVLSHLRLHVCDLNRTVSRPNLDRRTRRRRVRRFNGEAGVNGCRWFSSRL